MEVTKREVILSISIFSILTIIGMMIYNLIDTKISDKSYIYDTAVRIEDSGMFQWCLDTYEGNAFIYGQLKALQPVKCPLDESKEYYYIKRNLEEYTEHTDVTYYTDSDGNTHREVETYWEWDVIGTDSFSTQTAEFCGVQFPENKFHIESLEYIGRKKVGYHKRYVYYGYPAISKGTIFTKLENNTIPDKCSLSSKTIEDYVKDGKSKFPLYFFLVGWILLEIFAVVGFLYLDNDWLNYD